MPPRHAYWTILIDRSPTAFRSRRREELLPAFNQLRRTNPVIEMKWFGRGKLWDNPEQARSARTALPAREPRGRDWRPGGDHKDPRARSSSARRPSRKAPNAGGARRRWKRR